MTREPSLTSLSHDESPSQVPAARVAAAAAAFGARRASGWPRARQTHLARASAAAGGASAADPWKALGVPQGADADAIKKALDRKKLLYKSEPEKLAAMETAYESMSMRRFLHGRTETVRRACVLFHGAVLVVVDHAVSRSGRMPEMTFWSL